MAATTDVPARALIINADDFGLSEGINCGILEGHRAGAITSTSIMVGMPAFADAVHLARAAPALGVGLHFTLTAGKPLTAAPSLIDEHTGNFLGVSALVRRALVGRVRPREVEGECAAQIAVAREAGVGLTHLDGHHHIHLLPGVRAAVRRVVAAERIPAVRRPNERVFGGIARRRLPERALVGAFAHYVDSRKWGVATTNHFVGSALLGASDFHSLLLRVLDSLPGGITELMVHPGHVTAPLPGNDAYTTQRETELQALMSPDVRARLRRGDIRLLSYGQIRDAR
ncbi:MAG TPA: ChbG/HpnK family deacetylase [Gemmatimonadaceae bacterium]|nr:ChbG/HpnK family deacetylase [Gemmatimonadaceae bacterium]